MPKVILTAPEVLNELLPPMVPVLVPPAVLKVAEEPVIMALTAIPPVVPLAVNVNAPDAVMVLDTVMVPAPASVSVRLNIAPVEAPPIVTAAESEM